MSEYKIRFFHKIITPKKPMQKGGYDGDKISDGTYADDSFGYITNASGYDLNYYKSMSSLLKCGQGEVFIKTEKI